MIEWLVRHLGINEQNAPHWLVSWTEEEEEEREGPGGGKGEPSPHAQPVFLLLSLTFLMLVFSPTLRKQTTEKVASPGRRPRAWGPPLLCVPTAEQPSFWPLPGFLDLLEWTRSWGCGTRRTSSWDFQLPGLLGQNKRSLFNLRGSVLRRRPPRRCGGHPQPIPSTATGPVRPVVGHLFCLPSKSS